MNKKRKNIKNLLSIVSKLRNPKNGCPWDKKQTFESIIPYSIEEVYEVAEEIYKKNYVKLKEELGDLLLQIIYLSQIAKEKNKFNFYDVIESVSNKMVYRHPHVFKNRKFKNIKEHSKWWEESKNKKLKSIFDDIPNSYPSITKALKIQKKVSKIGFDYKDDEQALNKVQEELNELKKELKKKNIKKFKEELGDLLFASIDFSRKCGQNPEYILGKANIKFIKRFQFIEKELLKQKKDIKKTKIKEFEKLWKKSKIHNFSL